jgi:C3HC zinc finger-like/Rsm1-like
LANCQKRGPSLDGVLPLLAIMYAIETKKRKFDRILETIKDHAKPRPETSSTPPGENMSTTSLAESYSAKKRRLDPTTMTSKNSSAVSAPKTAHYLPSSREAFLERLETFGPITKWHVPSTEEISAAAWAKRGWWCIDTDMVACKACSEQLVVKLDQQEEDAATEAAAQEDKEEDDLDTAAMLRHRLLVDKYRDMIISAHAQSCPWRNRGCDDSIQRISGLLNTTNTLQTLKARYDSLRNLDIPSVHVMAIDFPYPMVEMAAFRLSINQPEEVHQDTLRLAMCGWQASPNREDVAECRACFRSLGLWLYRGDEPIMEKLDAVESHLEYCPWRSPSTQRTEIELGGQKRMVPAWVLVARTIKETADHPAVDAAAENQQQEPVEMGEKERETKVKQLLRRVKELKKPFNVRALLRRKPAES